MVNLLLMGTNADKKLHAFLEKALSSYFEVTSLSSRSCTVKEQAEFLLWDCEHTAVVHSSPTILILRYNTGSLEPVTFEDVPNPVIVVPSGNREALEFAASCGIPAVTCGLGSKDTFTLSSFVEHEAVLSLQRSISAFDGGVLEPVEIPVRLSQPFDHYALLALGAVLAFTGKLSCFDKLKL